MNNVNSTRTTLYPSTCPSEVGVSAVSLEGHPLLPIKRYWSSFRRHHSKSEVAKDKNMTTRTNRLGFVPTLLLLLIIQWETFPRVSSGTVAHSHPNGNSVGVGESGSGESKNETGTGTGWTGTTKDKGHRRQGRDYSPPSAGAQQQYMSPPIQHSPAYAAPIPAYAPPQTSYGSPPASSYGSPAQPIMMQSGYGVPSMGHYAIPPIVMVGTEIHILRFWIQLNFLYGHVSKGKIVSHVIDFPSPLSGQVPLTRFVFSYFVSDVNRWCIYGWYSRVLAVTGIMGWMMREVAAADMEDPNWLVSSDSKDSRD